MKKKKLLSLLGLTFALSVTTIGCGNIASSDLTGMEASQSPIPSSEEESTTSAEESTATTEESSVSTENTTEDTLIYGTVNLPYADFYYGELNAIEAETTATTGQYDVEDIAASAGYEEEGMYDAVTSATTQKSKRFEATYYEEVDTGVNILGVANVNVAISKALYEDVQNAIAAGTECKNPLIEIVSAMTVSEQTPVEYKVINSDGTLSKTIGNTVTADNVTATLTTLSSWGNYQVNFEGLELDAAVVQGAILETSDGAVYGLQHEDNLWLQPSELSVAVVPFTESHGNEVAYQRTADLPGKTITKITYLVANGDDIEINTDLFCNQLLSEEYGIAGDETVTYSGEGTKINVSLTVPADSSYALSAVSFGRTAMDISNVTYEDHTLTLPAVFTPGSYKISFEDELYCGLRLTVLVESGLSESDVSFDGTTIQLAEETGFTGAQYIANLSSAMVNGEKVSGKGLSSILFTEDGSLNLEAQTTINEETVAIFPAGGSYEVTLESTGYPAVTFTVER